MEELILWNLTLISPINVIPKTGKGAEQGVHRLIYDKYLFSMDRLGRLSE